MTWTAHLDDFRKMDPSLFILYFTQYCLSNLFNLSIQLNSFFKEENPTLENVEALIEFLEKKMGKDILATFIVFFLHASMERKIVKSHSVKFNRKKCHLSYVI